MRGCGKGCAGVCVVLGRTLQTQTVAGELAMAEAAWRRGEGGGDCDGQGGGDVGGSSEEAMVAEARTWRRRARQQKAAGRGRGAAACRLAPEL